MNKLSLISEIPIAICAISWAIAGIFHAIAQHEEAKFWKEPVDDDDEKDDADWWKEEAK